LNEGSGDLLFSTSQDLKTAKETANNFPIPSRNLLPGSQITCDIISAEGILHGAAGRRQRLEISNHRLPK
jgi:hypothetical protein